MRGAIQHLEERILRTGRVRRQPEKYPPIQRGEYAILHVLGDEQDQGQDTVQMIDRVELGGHRILLRDLAQWLIELHGHAQKLAMAWW